MSIAASFPNLRPSLLLDFANSKTVDSRVTFTRSTTAKYYDGVTTAKAEENLLRYSQEFENAAWSRARATVTANTEIAPDGTTTAETFAATDVDGEVFQTASLVGEFTFSVWIKRKTGTGDVSLRFSSGVGSIVAVTSDWQRFSFTATRSGSSFITVRLATSGDEVYLWGAQLEQRSQATAYTPTTTQPITNYIPVLQTAAAGVPRIDHDPVTGECLGLLIEEQRTNLLTWSESFRSQTLAVTGVSGTFVDGETVTATGGGTGIYVLADSTGSSFAIFNGSGTFTGTLTGGTSGATATISSSVAAWTPLGTTVTANTIVSPDGTLTGDKLYEDTGNTVHRITQAPITATSTTYTISVYAKAAERAFLLLRDASLGVGVWFNLSTGSVGTQNAGITGSITDVGNGWYRCSATRTTAVINTLWGIQVANSDASNIYTGDGYSGIYIWGAQLEAGAFPTSYIPTVATQETRNADAASMTGTNFSSWYNAGEGTLYAEADTNELTSTTFSNVVTIWDGTSSNRILLRSASTTADSAIVTNGVAQALLNKASVVSSNVAYKAALTFARNDVAYTANGLAAATTSTTILPIVDRMVVGGEGVAGSLSGHIRKISYYPQRLSDTNLQALTA